MNKIEAIRGYAKVQAILSLPLVFVCLTAAAWAGQIYIRHSGDTQWNPGDPGVFTITDTNDLGEFDAIMRSNATAGTTVNIGKGVFLTRGVWDGGWGQSSPPGEPDYGFRVQTGCTIAGQGKCGATSGTTLQLVEVKTSDYANIVLGGTTEVGLTNVTIRDLQIDCNAPQIMGLSDHPWYIQGVNLYSDDSVKIERVHVKNAGTRKVVPENFIVMIDSVADYSKNNVIADCLVSDFYQPVSTIGACSAISMNHFADDEPLSGVIGGRITGCEVVLDPSKAGGFAYNAHWARNLIISNNVSTGARRGFNNDSTPNEGLVIASNKFTFPKSATGLLILHDTHYSRIYSNWFVFTGPVWGQGSGSGFLISGPLDDSPGAGNLLLENNKVEYEGEWSTNSFGFHLYNNWISLTGKLHLERNSVVGLSNYFEPDYGPHYMFANSGAFPILTQGWQYTPLRLDFNLDERIDLICQNATNLEIQAGFFMDAATCQFTSPCFTNLAPSDPGGTWRVIGSGDINRDGRSDLFFQDDDGLLAYWLLDETSVLEPSAWGALDPVFPGSGWRVAAVGDFDGDTLPDLLFQNADGLLVVWYMNGIHRVGWVSLDTPGAASWRAVATGDFNTDGKVDILFQYLGGLYDGQLVVWYMDGATRTGWNFLNPMYPEGNDPQLRVAATGRFNCDASTDVVFQHEDLTNLVVWWMQERHRVGTNVFAGLVPAIKGPR